MYAKKKRSASAVTSGRRGSRTESLRLARHPASESRHDIGWRHRLRIQDLVQHFRRREPAQLGVRLEDQAMGQNGLRQGLDVIWGHEVASFESRSCLGASEQAERSP